jgi:molecular chaperone DnaK (HSP70)
MTAIALDFGTSNTVVCLLDPATQRPQSLVFDALSRSFQRGERRVHVIPSLAFVASPERLIIGQQVRAQRLAFAQPERCFREFKRDLAADFQSPPRLVDGVAYGVEAIAEWFLQTLWAQVKTQCSNGYEPPDHLIVTAPVGAFEHYLTWFRQVGDRLGISTVQVVDESTAAALGYAVRHPGARVLVIDFGGGTLDLSLVQTKLPNGPAASIRAEVIAKSDAYVGGVDIDTWIVEDYLSCLGSSRTDLGELGWQTLLELAERLKVRLSSEPIATESWFDDERFMAHDLTLSRDQLTELLENRQLLEQVRRGLDEVLAIAQSKGVGKGDIERVLMVGGSSLIPAVQQVVVAYFGRQKVKLHKPFEAVAHGALSVSELEGIDDHLRHSYAIRLWEPYANTYSYYKLFDQGTAYPCQRAEAVLLQVAREGQTEIRLDVGELAEINAAEVMYDDGGRLIRSTLNRLDRYRPLDQHQDQVCIAHLNPPGQVGIDRVAVTFEVNADRLLIATVRDLVTHQILVHQKAIARLQ